MEYMFMDLRKLTSVDLSSFTFNSGVNTHYMFRFSTCIEELIIPHTANNLWSDASLHKLLAVWGIINSSIQVENLNI